ncbi:tRNA (guanine-N(7)-)-methyltransferase [Paenibacillus sp. J31TS4]|uniref:tRNA (guanosine(46)-N7)-methyltransferase TrmB n=1 Tax=Paenibacillus sp. J31TS4 TaxID=2807195 RepID=UPI001B250F5D|nr:tRNA (guanosine(46)-N7)-methyltransferase TrmB [Paenibacillus sp. J31TS4]GIP38891.1 tRNA (guanine-N(7)-)-methyltransferase [Paenibacillus sp. J31TS4]
MRLRGKKGIRETLEQQPDLVVLQPSDWKGRWAEFFGNDRPIHVELGMGKGKFISELSAANPHINYIGVDMYDELLRKASGKVAQAHGAAGSEQEGAASEGSPGKRNIVLALMNIERLEEAFAENELERIYLNFSDPWPKTKHHRRRLTHPDFVRRYLKVLNDRGQVHFKTDSRILFEFSLNSFADMGLRMRNISLDLHADGLRDDLVPTEYELKFHEQGMPIYRCEVVIGKDALKEHEEALAGGGASSSRPKQADR